MIVFWSVESNLVYFRCILVWSVVVTVTWVVGNNFVYLRTILVGSMIMIVSWSYSLVGL